MRSSVKTKMLLSFSAVVALMGITATAVGLHFIGGRFYSEMQNKVLYDLNAAREVYNRAMADVSNTVRYTAGRILVKEALGGRQIDTAVSELAKVKEGESLDMLALMDSRGKVLVCAGNPALRGRNLSGNALVQEAMRSGRSVQSSLVMTAEALAAFDAGLAERAHIKFILTERAKSVTATEETSGLVFGSVCPVLDGSGRAIGFVFGGKLLNRSVDIVDKAKDILYGDAQYKGKNVGAVTIFQGDLRVSTNVRDRSGSRAIGTRIAANVADTVLGAGRSYFGRAFVVNDWYLTAYEPIKDLSGRTVGILYVGRLEQPFSDLKREVSLLFIGIVLLGVGLSLALAFLLSGVILSPVQKLMTASAHLGKGDLSHRVRIDSDDEFGALGRTFNLMADSIKERDEEILRNAQETIKGTEKLATIGQLAAGVAHEINNPLGGVLVYTHLLLEDTPPSDPRRENLEKIARETERVRDIVRGLLEFARQTESKVEDSDLNELVLKTLDLVDKQILFDGIRVEKDLGETLPILPIDRDKMRQVLLNVVMNAAEAMEGKGGLLRVATRYERPEGRVSVVVSDTGCGIRPEHLKRVFEPFFTTKEVGHGTGLGLAISYGIVKKHGGSIDVQSEFGKGTVVTVSLPAGALEGPDDSAD